MTFSCRNLAATLLVGVIYLSPASLLAARHHRRPRPVKAEKLIVKPGHEPPARLNLLPNGNFKSPAKDNTHPAHWQRVDNLVWFWQVDKTSPRRGKVLRIDTNVPEKLAYHWWIAHFLRRIPLRDAPPVRNRHSRYSSIAGLDGGFYWSGFIRIKPHAAIRVYVDAKGPASKVFIRGYTKRYPLKFASEEPAVEDAFAKAQGKKRIDKHGRQIMHRLHYLYTTWFPVGGSKTWKTYTYSMPRHPNDNEITQNVRYIRIMLYPSWPPANYWYDNVRVVEVTKR